MFIVNFCFYTLNCELSGASGHEQREETRRAAAGTYLWRWDTLGSMKEEEEVKGQQDTGGNEDEEIGAENE